jgi:hypothetical protein
MFALGGRDDAFDIGFSAVLMSTAYELIPRGMPSISGGSPRHADITADRPRYAGGDGFRLCSPTVL